MMWYEATALVAAIFIVFASAHSLLVSDAAKNTAARIFGKQFVASYYRFFFTLVSVATSILAVHLIVLIPDRTLFWPPIWLRVVCHSVQALAAVFAVAAFRIIRFGEFIGAEQFAKRISSGRVEGDEEGMTGGGIVTKGVYGLVRHPLYSSGIVIAIFNPYITRNWLTVEVLVVIYFLVGAVLEERRLIRHLGEEYTSYMQHVPRFIPKRFF